jgi:hypothetical protein
VKLLRQKSKLVSKSIEIGTDGVIYESKGFLEKIRFKVPFEHIQNEPAIYSSGVRRWLVIGLVLSILSLLSLVGLFNNPTADNFYSFLFFFVITFIALFIYWRSVNVYHGYLCFEKEILLFENKPNVEEFEGFISNLHKEKQKYLLQKGIQGNHHQATITSTIEELEKLALLRDNGTITEEEFQSLKVNIITGKSEEPKRIGFI